MSEAKTREEFLTAEIGTSEDQPDVQGVVVRVESEHITLEFEDGERIIFDAGELRSAVT